MITSHTYSLTNFLDHPEVLFTKSSRLAHVLPYNRIGERSSNFHFFRHELTWNNECASSCRMCAREVRHLPTLLDYDPGGNPEVVKGEYKREDGRNRAAGSLGFILQ
jgi:hypothetical protein